MPHFTPNVDGIKVLWDNRSVRSDKVSFGQIRYAPGGYCGPRWQQWYEIILLHSGECTVVTDGRRRVCHPGFSCLLRPGHKETLCFSANMETHHSWCKVIPSVLPLWCRQALDKITLTPVPPSDVFLRILSSAFVLRPQRDPHASQVAECLALALFAEFLDMSRPARSEDHNAKSVQLVINHMENFFREETCLAGARKVSGCSANSLTTHFKKATGLTPARYLWKLRTEKGLAMLADTGLTIAEIAYRCGFKNPFHFSRMVNQSQKLPPSALRRKIWRMEGKT